MAEIIGNIFPTKIPSLNDDADIREAFYLYHYGSDSGSGDIQTQSIAHYLGELRDDVDSKINKSSVQAVGDILVGTGEGTLDNLQIVETNGFEYVLSINNEALSSQDTTGLKWVMSGKEEERISNIMGVY
jgi:hypothetical protein